MFEQEIDLENYTIPPILIEKKIIQRQVDIFIIAIDKFFSILEKFELILNTPGKDLPPGFKSMQENLDKLKEILALNDIPSIQNNIQVKNNLDKLKLSILECNASLKNSNIPPELLKNFKTMLKNADLTFKNIGAQFEVNMKPSGIFQVYHLCRYQLALLQLNQSFLSNEEQNLKLLLENILETLKGYQDNDQTKISKFIKQINDFKKENSKTIIELTWLENVRKEAEVMKRKQEAIELRGGLDEEYKELMSQKTKIDTDLNKKISHVKNQYKHKSKSSNRFFNPIRFFKYHREKHKVYKEHDVKLRQYRIEYKKFLKAKTQFSTKMQGLTSEAMALSGAESVAIIPASFAQSREIKLMASEYGGIVLGGMAQSKIVALGTLGGLCYGFTKDWLEVVKEININNLDELHAFDQILDKFQHIETEKKYFSDPVNNLKLNEKIYEYQNEQFVDRAEMGHGKKRDKHKIDNIWIQNTLKTLEGIRPAGVSLDIYSEKSGHSIGLAKTKEGILFFDSNLGNMYFKYGDNKKNTEQNFVQFLDKYLKQYYPDYQQSMITIPKFESAEKMQNKGLAAGKKDYTPSFVKENPKKTLKELEDRELSSEKKPKLK